MIGRIRKNKVEEESRSGSFPGRLPAGFRHLQFGKGRQRNARPSSIIWMRPGEAYQSNGASGVDQVACPVAQGIRYVPARGSQRH